jgi:uncharacterized membrane protein
MARRGFLARHGIVRNAIREDVLYFALPAFFVYSAGLVVSAWDLIRHQGSPFIISVHSIVGLALIIIEIQLFLLPTLHSGGFTLRLW